MQVAFRTDASIEIGTGHVMRCLTLARALRDAGAACHFITRAHPGHLGERITDAGFRVSLLQAPASAVLDAADGSDDASDEPTAHAAWAGAGWTQDAQETRAALGDDAPDWLVVDHYALDIRWQRAVRRPGTKLMVIDDLADRAHECELLLDQTLGRRAEDYDPWVPAHCTRLMGPQFAMLRPEFAALRARALSDRTGRGLRKVLITMGGMDAQDATSRVLAALADADLPRDVALSIVMGAQAPALERVRAVANSLPWPAEVVTDVPDMATRMADADLAIGAAGATTWERCCLGLPSVMVEIAQNQAAIARALRASGAALDPGPPTAPNFAPRLVAAVAAARDRLDAMSQQAAAICDGDGVGRVLAHLVPARTSFRPATAADSRRVWEWRAASGLERFSLSGQMPGFADHDRWFRAALHDPQRKFRIFLHNGRPCGYLRLDLTDKDRARVSICLAPDARGQGLAATLLAEGTRAGIAQGLTRLDAEIHPENKASLRCFKQAGYSRGDDAERFRIYHLDLREG